MYHRWPRRIGQIEVCLIQPPARENRIREPHYGSYGELAAALVDYLPPYLDKPFAFFGHCGGALPGVELTHRLDAAGLPTPRWLFASSQVAPHDGPYGRFLSLEADELAVELGQLITSLGGRPTPSLIEMSLELLDADLEANRRYRVPAPVRLPCGITVIGWTRDSEIPMEKMGGWREWSASCRYALIEGGHYEFLDAPPALLTEIERDMSDEITRPGHACTPPPAGA
jgi:surfactin synthase thioesterase subunit